MIRAFNQDATTAIRFGRVALTSLATWAAMPQASGGAALNLTTFGSTPTVWEGGAEKTDPSLRMLFVPSGTWAACDIVIQSPSGDETISIPAASTAPVRSAKAFKRTDIAKVITSKDPGAMAKLDAYWTHDAGCRPCDASAKAADAMGICLKINNTDPRTWGAISGSTELVCIEKSGTGTENVNDDILLLSDGRGRAKAAGDTTGVIVGKVRLPTFSFRGIILIPITWEPRDL